MKVGGRLCLRSLSERPGLSPILMHDISDARESC